MLGHSDPGDDCSSSSFSNASISNDLKTHREPSPSPSYVYHEISHASGGNFCTKSYEKVLLVSQPRREQVAIRIRHSSGGYSEWLNELQCYLLPNFKHKHILKYYGSQESNSDESGQFAKLGHYVRFLDNEDPRTQETVRVVAVPKHAPRMEAPPPMDPPDHTEPETTRIGPFRVEYWLMTKFCDSSLTLRDFLMVNTLTWAQMIKITKGIMKGLYFLHENHEYQNFDCDNLIDSFIDSTNGALRRVAFKDPIHVIHMKPHLNLTIVHRNLCSKNIVIKRNLTPCIWNFGQAYIHHPFQPTNQRQLIDDETKRKLLLSHYSPPELLQEKGHLSLAAMKSIDMYASGIIMWELISRCVLPKLEGPVSQFEARERQEPDEYIEPLAREFGRHGGDPLFTDNVVCSKRVRPRLKLGWLVGRKTNRYVQTMKDLWDPDYDARLHSATVICRLNGLSLSDRDRRNKYFPPLGRVFLAETAHWPNENYMKGFQAPIPGACQPNKVFDDYTEMPASKRPHWISSSEDEANQGDHHQEEADDKFDEAHSRALLHNYELLRTRRIRAQARARRLNMRKMHDETAKVTSTTKDHHHETVGNSSGGGGATMETVENSFEMISIKKEE